MNFLIKIIFILSIQLLQASEISQEKLNASSNIYYNWKDGLALNQEQITEIKKILTEYRIQYGFIQDDYTRLTGLNRNLFESNQYDFDYYQNTSLEIEKKRLAIEKNFFKQIHSLLTPEQRKIFGNTIHEWSIKR